MTPKLTEVFVVKEASVQSLAQRYKVPVDFAEWVNEDSSRHADTLIALFVWANGYTDLRNTSMNELDKQYGNFMFQAGSDIIALLDRYPAKKKELMAVTSEPASTGSRMDSWVKVRQATMELTPKPDLSSRAELKLADGSYWVELTGEERDQEGEEMQHCGRTLAARSKMYSLRDKIGKSHITAEVDNRMAKGGPIPTLMQCKGKQNEAPERKYWESVVGLCRKLKCVPNSEGGYDETEDRLFDYLRETLHHDMIDWATGEG